MLYFCCLHVPKLSVFSGVSNTYTLDTYALWHSRSYSHYNMFKFVMPVVTGRRPNSLHLYKEAYLPISVTLNWVFTNPIFRLGTAYILLSSLHSFPEFSWTYIYSQPLIG